MLNRVILVGRLTKDPELRVSQSNVAVANFNLAVNRPFTDKNGERGADFINCVVFRKPAENLVKYTSKGSLVGIDGRIQTRNYENKDGQRVYVTEVICDQVQYLDSKGSNSDTGSNPQGSNSYNHQQQSGASNVSYGTQKNDENPFANSKGPVDIQDDDLPF